MEAVVPTSASADMRSARVGGVGRPTRSIRRLVDARQLTPDELAALRAENPGVDFDVPSDMPNALSIFFTNPSILIIVAGLCVLLYLRVTAGVALSPLDLISMPIVSVGWTVQEWAIHKFLLHGWKGWYGHDTHMAHHRLPFYHISIDPPEVVLAWGAVACALFYVAIPLRHIAHTCLCVYWLMGLLYEFAHYIVHTRVRFSGGLGKAIKQHHTRHHLKDDRYWFAFTVPAIDDVMGSVPSKTHTAQTAARTQ